MRRLLNLLLFLALPIPLFSQNLTTVTAVKISRGGVLLSSGRICFQATDSDDNALSFRVGGGGQLVNAPYCNNVTNGAIVGSMQVANPLNTAPAYISYRVTVTTTTGSQILRYPGVQFTTPTFNFDNFVPSANLPLGTSTNLLNVGIEVLSNYTDIAQVPNPGNPQTGFDRIYTDQSTGLLSCITSTGANCNPAGGGSAFSGGLGTSFQDASEITPPANPSAGNDRLWLDNATHLLSCKTSGGVNCIPGTTFGNFANITFLGNITGSPATPVASQVKTIYLADFSPTAPSTAGKIPIYDPNAANAAGGTGAYVPGDPFVQGLFAEGGTTAQNPIAIGGFDTAGSPAIHGIKVLNGNPAGTEYAIVTRPIPSGTQAISAASLPLPTGAALDATLTGGTTKAINRGGQKGTTSTNADITHTPSGANHELLDIGLYDASGNQIGTSGAPVRTDTTGTTTQPISATALPLPAGAAQDTSVTGLEVAQASTTSGQKGILSLGAVTTAAPSYTTAQTSPLSLDIAGNLRTAVTNTVAENQTQINGSSIVTSATGVQKVGIVGSAGATLDFAGQNAASPANALLAGCQFNTTPTTITTGNASPCQLDAAGNLKVNIIAGGGTGGGPADVGLTTAASETDAARQKVTTALRLLDTSQSAGSQLVGAKGDQTSGMWVNCKSGCSAAGDQSTGSTALGAANAVITIPLAGENKATFQLQSGGTGVYTVTPQCSFDNGTIYNVNGVIEDPLSGQLTSTATVASAQATTDYPVLCPQGASNAQIKVTAYTSGTANWLARATVNSGPNLAFGIVTTAAPSPSNNTFNPLSLTTTGALRTDNSAVTQPVNVTQYGGTSTTLGQKVMASSIPVVPASDYVPSDTVGTLGALNASNAAASVTTNGQLGVSAIIAAGTLTGTITPEISTDGGTTWTATYFALPSGQIVPTRVYTNPNVADQLTVVVPPGASNARVRVSSFTSGTANATLRASEIDTGAPVLYAGPVNTIAPPLADQMGGSDGTNIQALRAANTTPGGSEFGLITRNIPSGTQTISGTVTATQATGTNLHMVCDSGCSGSAGFADNATFTIGTTAINPVGGIFDDTPPTAIATGKAASARITNNRALHINLRNQAGTEIGTSGAPVRTDPTGTTTQPISAASLPLPTGAALDASVTGLQVAQGSTTSGEKGGLALGAVTTAAPSYTTAQTSPLSLTTAGALRVDGSGATQPISGTVAISTTSFISTQATAANLNAQVVGNIASGASDSGNPVKTGGVFTTTQPTVTTGQRVDTQMTARGGQIVSTGVDIFHITVDSAPTTTVNIGTSGSLALDASVTGLEVAQGSTTSGQKGVLDLCAVTTAAPSYTTAQSSPCSLDIAGNLRTSVLNTVTVSGTVTTTPPSNASTNVTQFGSTNLSTGTGVSGAGIPRVTVSSDSSLTANIGTTGGLALDATLTGGTAKAIVRGGAKGSTTATDVTSTSSGANHQPVDVAIYDASGNQITTFGGGTQYAENTTQATATGTVALGKNASNVVFPLQLDVNKNLLIGGGSPNGTLVSASENSVLTAGSDNGWGPVNPPGALPTKRTEYVDIYGRQHIVCDGGCTSSFTVQAGIRQLPALPVAGTFGRPVQSTNDALNVYSTNPIDPCDGRKGTAPISQIANAVIVQGAAGDRILACAVMLNGADAENISWVEGSGATCGTNTLALVGGTIAANGNNMVIGQGYTFGNGRGTIFSTNVPGDSLCLLQSGSGRVAGVLSFVYAN